MFLPSHIHEAGAPVTLLHIFFVFTKDWKPSQKPGGSIQISSLWGECCGCCRHWLIGLVLQQVWASIGPSVYAHSECHRSCVCAQIESLQLPVTYRCSYCLPVSQGFICLGIWLDKYISQGQSYCCQYSRLLMSKTISFTVAFGGAQFIGRPLLHTRWSQGYSLEQLV